MDTFIRISTLCTLMSCISLGCSKPPDSSRTSDDKWQIPDWIEASDPSIAERREELAMDLQAQVASGRLDEEGYQRELALVPGQIVSERRLERLKRMRFLLEDQGFQIKLTLQDLNDEIQSFIAAKGLYSLGGLEGTPEWNVLEGLSADLLEIRIEIRIAEGELVEDEVNARSRIVELKKRLAAMDAEYELLDASLRDRCANASILDLMLTTRQSLVELREENQRARARLRMQRLIPAEDEQLLFVILGE